MLSIMPKSVTYYARVLRRKSNKLQRLGLYKPVEREPAPVTRQDCVEVMRPCPHVACKYHLFTDVTVMGTAKFPFGDDVEVLESMPETCALDVADDGDHSRMQVAEFLNITIQRVQQLEVNALRKLTKALGKLG